MTPATRQGLSIGVATGVYAVSFGALSVAAGLSVWETQALSLLMFTGGSQFGFVGVIAGGGAPATAISTASLLGVRNAIYGIQNNAMLKERGWRKILAAHLTIDESTATGAGQLDPAEQRRGFWAAGLAVFAFWNLFTLVGALVGNTLGDTNRFGLDGAAVAAFLGLLWPRLATGEGRAVAVVCALVTLLVTPALPAGTPILVAAAVALAIGWWRRGADGGEPTALPMEDHPEAHGSTRHDEVGR